MQQVKSPADFVDGDLRLCRVFRQRRNSNAYAVAVVFGRWNVKRHPAKSLRSWRKVDEIVVRFVDPTRHTFGSFAGVAVSLSTQIKRNKLCRRTVNLLAAQNARQKVAMPLGNLVHAAQNVYAILFGPMLKATTRQFARRACQYSAVHVVPYTLLTAEALQERRVDRIELARRCGGHLLANRLITRDDSTGLLL